MTPAATAQSPLGRDGFRRQGIVPLPGRRLPVPVEAIGRARLLRQRVAAPAAAWAALSLELLRPFAGPNLTPFSRRTLLARLPDTWRDLPEFGRLSLRIDPGDPVRMFETRAFPFIVGRDEWDADELSIAVAVRRLAVRLSPKPAVDSNVAIVAVIGLHGLARRYERGDDISDEAVLRDLEVLTDARAWRTGIRDSRSEFDVPVTGGCWRGAAAMLDGQPALAVRTFVA